MMKNFTDDYTTNIEKMPHMEMFNVVIFTGGDFPMPEDTVSYWKVHKPDYVIAADSGVNTLKTYLDFFAGRSKKINFEPDLIVGDFDSITDVSALSKFKNSQIIKYDSYKDYTDTEIAIYHAYKFTKKKKQRFITVIGGHGGRIDHTLAIYDSFSSSSRADAWLLKNEAVYFFKKGSVCKLEKIRAKDVVSVARTTKSYSSGNVVSFGLEWEGDVFRKKGFPSISNKIDRKKYAQKKCIEMYANASDFLVIAPISAVCTFSVK